MIALSEYIPSDDEDEDDDDDDELLFTARAASKSSLNLRGIRFREAFLGFEFELKPALN